MTDSLTQWIIDIIAAGGYWGIALLMAIENVFPPIPSEVIMGLGGMAVQRGQMNFWAVLLAGTIGCTMGNMAWYELGRKLGYQGLRPFIDRYGRWLTMDWDDVEASVRFFQRHGHHVVFWLRFSPLMRTIISLPAGLAGMGRIRFIGFTFAGAAIWNIFLLGAGYYLGANFAAAERFIGPVAIATIVIVVGVYIYRQIMWSRRKG